MLDGEVTGTDALRFDVATAAIKGARDYQEDSVISCFPLGQATGFAVVADGIGGHAAGHVASALVTAEAFGQMKMKDAELDAGTLNIPVVLRDIAEAASTRVAAHVKTDDETHGMGSTLLMPVIRGAKLYWISVGDSPLFLFRDGALRQLNKDHSMAPQIDMMVKMGSMSAEVGRNHPDRNTLTSVINGDAIDMIDCPTTPMALLPDDIIIASSDGLQFLSNTMIANTLMLASDGRSVDIANALLAAIAQRDDPEQDNTAFVVIKLGVSLQPPDAQDAEDIPVLAMADPEDAADETAASDDAAAPVADPSEEDVKDERKAYWYRGQKYYRD